MLNSWVEPIHTPAEPVMLPGIFGILEFTLSASVFVVLKHPDLFAATVMFPFNAEEATLTVRKVSVVLPIGVYPGLG